MIYSKLTDNITVSRLAIGTLTVSKMQAGLPENEAAAVLAYAFDRGITFADTAQYYENYHLIRMALARCHSPEKVVISTKTYAYSKELAEAAVEEARCMLDRDVIDIFMLHEQESIDTLRGHMPAYEYLLECRDKGIIRAVGASTHHIAAVRGLTELKAHGIPVDICHPLYNIAGIGIADGGEDEMSAVLETAHREGIGIFAMKALGGGHLCASAEEALGFVLSKSFIDAAAVGMQSFAEVDANIRFIESGSFSPEDRDSLSRKKRILHVEEYCEGCGACVKRCGQSALRLVPVSAAESAQYDFVSEFAVEYGISQKDSSDKVKYRAEPNEALCVHCGYCTKVCPVFALKVY